jgi:hypothetical protein
MCVASVQHMSLEGIETAQSWLGSGERKQVSLGTLKLPPSSLEVFASVTMRLCAVLLSAVVRAAAVVRAQHEVSSTDGIRWAVVAGET